MTTRFFLIIAMLLILFAGWLYVGYENAISHQAKLESIAKLPIYAYVADTTKVLPILTELKPIPAIKSVVHETAEQATKELITAYDLPLNEDMVTDYAFPDVVTITLEPVTQALKSKPIILDILRSHIGEGDIDSQASAYNSLSSELQVIQRRSIAFHVYSAVLLLLIFVFCRLSFELHVLLLNKGKRHSVVDTIRHQKQGIQHTWFMLLIPLPVSIIAYFAYCYFRHIPFLLPYWVFIVQAGAAFTATLITHFTLHTFEHEVAFDEQPVQVINPITITAIPEDEDETQPS